MVFDFCFMNLFTVKGFDFTSHTEKRLHSSLHLTTIIYSYCENNSTPESAGSGIHHILHRYLWRYSGCSCAAGTPLLSSSFKEAGVACPHSLPNEVNWKEYFL